MDDFEPNNPTMKKVVSDTDSSSEKELQLSESRSAFIKWAVHNAIPINCIQPLRLDDDDDDDDDGKEDQNDPFLSCLDGAIECSSASVVLLSEGFHNCKEMMMLHHRIIQHLIIHSGFQLVATESGMPESRDVANYITSSSDREYSKIEKETLWKKGLNQMYSAWVEGRELIEWMRGYNKKKMRQSIPIQQHPQKMIAYCGLDIGGFYSDWTYPMSKIQNYLKVQFPDFEAEWSRKIKPILDVMGNVQARYNYQHLLTPGQKSTLAILLDELVMELNSHGDELEGDFEFEWAKQSAISMQLAENYYRNYENMLLTDAGTGIISKYSGLDGREIAMANTMMWRLNLNHGEKDEATRAVNGKKKKMVVINHVIHTKTATQYQGKIWGHFVPMGQLMKQMLTYHDQSSERNAMFNIGMLYGSGTFWNKWQKPQERFIDTSPLTPNDNDGLENVMKQISKESNMPNFFLHWEMAPKEAWVYLNEASTIRENDYNIRAYPLEWNGCVYLDIASPATPAAS